MNDLVNQSISGGGINIGELTYPELKSMCKQQGLSGAGKKVDLIKRLTIAKEGNMAKHVHGRTKCRICGERTAVMGTSRKKMSDGRILVTRQMRCVGKHHHTYPLKMIEGVAK